MKSTDNGCLKVNFGEVGVRAQLIEVGSGEPKKSAANRQIGLQKASKVTLSGLYQTRKHGALRVDAPEAIALYINRRHPHALRRRCQSKVPRGRFTLGPKKVCTTVSGSAVPICHHDPKLRGQAPLSGNGGRRYYESRRHPPGGARLMPRKRHTQGDPIEHEIELVLNPGVIIPYGASFSFVSKLDGVAAKIAKLISSDPTRATALYETFLAACYLKIEELDDSSGSFGQFVGEIYCGWIKARQANKADPNETAIQLLTWIDQDDYGFCYRLEMDAAKVFNKANLAAFVSLVRERFEAAGKKRTAKDDEKLWKRSDYLRRHWGEVLRTLYAAQKDVAAYVTLAEETGLTAKDCHAIATLLVSKRKPEEALTWVERGFEVNKEDPHRSMSSHDLAELKRDLLTKLGRGDEALDAAWDDYRKHPSTYTYDDLMKYVPKSQRKQWHDKAIEAAMGGDIRSIMELFRKTKELDRLADIVRQAKDDDLEDLGLYATEPVAKKLERSHPDLAARLWRAQGLRIVNTKKSKCYDTALSNLENAKHCFERAGQQDEWSKTVCQIRAAHHRKSRFMPRFERLVAGTGPSDEPSFLDLAKARWNTKEQRTR